MFFQIVMTGLLFQGLACFDTDNGLDEETDYLTKNIQIAFKVANDPELKADWDRKVEEAKRRDFVFGPPVFNCSTDIQKEPATTVHELAPSDIQVIAAMGDSITAGFGVGAENIMEVFTDADRGESWSVGSQRTLDNGVITLATLLQQFNPDLQGYSQCKSGRLSRHGWLNVAMGGATNRAMPGQARDVVNICQSDDRVNNNNDWKLITLLVGGNDLCASCYNDNFNATSYRRRIEEALDIYHNELPRAFVNLVAMFDITPLRNFSDGAFCESFQSFACQCGITDEHRPNVRNTQLEYYEQLKQLVDSGKYDTKDDFTVVLQPMLVDLVPPIDPDTGFYDKSFLSHDCFHPSLKAHQAFAYALWNTMFIPYDEKPRSMDIEEENPTFTCPTETTPFFTTRQNSRKGRKANDTKYRAG